MESRPLATHREHPGPRCRVESVTEPRHAIAMLVRRAITAGMPFAWVTMERVEAAPGVLGGPATGRTSDGPNRRRAEPVHT
ncbi:hypothetical protein [Parafrankia sp. EUN1f]|uniref:hypothetical protein n=1 Tax=Parafrankia sp. EUN1f TaxID=102897 RepID=UPI0001C455CA|nr:hypothetical protein [Parafrankia sp. EUN1f]EFC84341.1 hypothetical protein FrEUN1fDRAFT_2522 [Parafrankia sp. EUN1f]